MGRMPPETSAVVVGRIIKEKITPKSKIGASSLGFKYIVYRLPA